MGYLKTLTVCKKLKTNCNNYWIIIKLIGKFISTIYIYFPIEYWHEALVNSKYLLPILPILNRIILARIIYNKNPKTSMYLLVYIIYCYVNI